MTTLQDDILRIVMKGTYQLGGSDIINVLHFQSLDLTPLNDAQLLLDIGVMLETILIDLANLQASTYKYVSYEVTNVTQGFQLGSLPYPNFEDGGGLADVVSSQISLLTIFDTAKSRVQGRIFFGGMVESLINQSQWDNVLLAAAANVILELLTPQPVTVGRLLYAVFSKTLNTVTLPVGGTVITKSRTQRRRTQFFGS